MMLDLVFWSSVALVLYAYLGYPCGLLALSLVRHRPVRKGPAVPDVSFIITAHNEAGRIAQKLENTIGQNYPTRSLEIIVASDCSTDETDEIVGRYSSRVRLVRARERKGKEAAQRLAIEASSGSILIFSDVATALGREGVATIVQNFLDPTVGCVSSVDRFVDADGRTSGEAAYVRYEMLLRSLETRVNTLVGLSGSFFAARRIVCRRWADGRQSDFSTLLNAVEMGFRGVLDPQSAGYYQNITDQSREFERKIRTVVRGLAVLVSNARMLNPFRFGLFAWQLASHKLCRWLVPCGMVGALLSNVLLASGSTFYTATLALQAAFYGAAIGGLWTDLRILRLPSFLVLANLAVLSAWVRYVRGDRMIVWKPSERATGLPRTSAQ